MIVELSPAEERVAKEACKGISDKEIAHNLQKSVYTIVTQKRKIYRKLGISKETELLLYMIARRLKRDFDIKEIRKHGIELFFSVLFLCIQVSSHNAIDMRVVRTPQRPVTARYVRAGRRNNENNDLCLQ